ncbi:Agamous-like MADS-box protein [Nymphaea thermarum]|nr:Agamous-like MADS-box protein [Nymphaea thermarum]
MARKKVNLAWISKDSARKATFKKRKKGLIKKVSELSTLCGIKACAIVFGPSETTPEIWPPTAAAIRQVIEKFNDLPQVEKSKKMLNQEGFLRQRIAKLKEQQAKLAKDNKELEMKTKLIKGMKDKAALHGAGMDELHALMCIVDARMAKVRGRNESLVSYGPPCMQLPPQLMPMPPTLPPLPPALLREDERRQVQGISFMDQQVPGEPQYLVDFLESLENYPTEWPYVDGNQWTYPGPLL